MKRDDEEDESKKDSFEDEPEEHEESSDELEEEMEIGEKEEDVYSEEGREKLVEDDEIDSWEAGFAEGADGQRECGASQRGTGDRDTAGRD